MTPSRFPARQHRPPSAQRGAALLLAMTLLALVASLAAGMVWQQWRAVQVESAERSRGQSTWILAGALDWTRLILREDVRSGAVDHAGEPWATPLAEARLSSFLAADREASADSEVEAFLSGSITDAQARYNLRNLFTDEGQAVALERDTLGRLCAAAGLTPGNTERIITGLAGAWRARSATPAGGGSSAPGTGAGAGASTSEEDTRVLPVQRFEHLAWLGLEPDVLQALRPLVDVLPTRTPVNLNTAGREVLAAVLAVDAGTAERLVQARQQQAFERLDQVRALLPPGSPLESSRVSLGSQYFEVRGRLRLEDRVLEEASLVRRRGTAEVLAVHRLRRNLQATTE
ncbi:MAG: type II secretion system minor pseudopilin GspK [Rubrivivax sp.]|jgi:general secretion pathway protein K|nr:type II secretion system minor pseudopilin GspK [Rubrivivax sp.]